MSTWWNPKPLRPAPTNPIFKLVDTATVVRIPTPMERQRRLDGTQYTIGAKSDLHPGDAPLYINKGSLVEKVEQKKPKYSQPDTDPKDPLGIVKAYMESSSTKKGCSPDEEKADSSTAEKSLAKLDSAISSLKKSIKLVTG